MAFVFLSPVRSIYSLPLPSAAKHTASWTPSLGVLPELQAPLLTSLAPLTRVDPSMGNPLLGLFGASQGLENGTALGLV